MKRPPSCEIPTGAKSLTIKLPAGVHGTAKGKTVKVPSPLEKVVQAEVIAAIRAAGLWCERHNTGSAMLPGRNGKLQPVNFGQRGSADIYALLPGGRAMFVEVKRKGKRPSPEQLAWLLARQADGAVAMWTDNAECFRWQLLSILHGGTVEMDRFGGMLFKGGTKPFGGFLGD